MQRPELISFVQVFFLCKVEGCNPVRSIVICPLCNLQEHLSKVNASLQVSERTKAAAEKFLTDANQRLRDEQQRSEHFQSQLLQCQEELKEVKSASAAENEKVLKAGRDLQAELFQARQEV